MTHPISAEQRTSAETAALLAVLILAAAVWIGGYVAIAVVSRSAAQCLPPELRIAFFRRLGRAYSRVGTTALVIALAAGAALVHGRPMDGRAMTAVVLAAALVVAVAFGVVQARQIGRLRREALGRPDDSQLARRVARGARRAVLLRASIGVFSVALFGVGISLGVR
jgi:uncharacterized membrane protein